MGLDGGSLKGVPRRRSRTLPKPPRRTRPRDRRTGGSRYGRQDRVRGRRGTGGTKVDSRQGTLDKKRQTKSRRQETGDKEQDTVRSRRRKGGAVKRGTGEETAGSRFRRQETLSGRKQETGDTGQETVNRRTEDRRQESGTENSGQQTQETGGIGQEVQKSVR